MATRKLWHQLAYDRNASCNWPYSINPHVCRYNVACTFMLAGKTERALDLLEEHARLDAIHADWLEQDSDWDAARDNPRFKAIIASLH